MLDTTDNQRLLDALFDATVLLDTVGCIVAANRKWREFAAENGGDTETFYLGGNYLEVCDEAEGEDDAEASVVSEGVRSVLAGANEFRCEYPCHSPTEQRWFEVAVVPVHLDSGRQVMVGHRNITSRKIQQEEIARSRISANELAALVASSKDAIMSYDLQGNILTWNRAAEKLYGYKADEVIGRSMEVLYPEDWPQRITEYRDKIISGELSTFEVVRKAKDGNLRTVSVSAAPVRDIAGEIVSISNFHRDITDQKAVEERLKFATRELNHRTKNIFAVIGGIQRQTARGAASVEDFQEKFSSRLRSLLASNELLVSQDWRAVSLDELCRSQISIFGDAQSAITIVEGPPVVLKIDAVHALGMALHELATNALKHGALAGEGGRVTLTWELPQGTRSRYLTVTWKERGAPIDKAPSHRGFGHTVLTRNIEESLDAQVSLEFGVEGLEWTASVPEPHFVTV